MQISYLNSNLFRCTSISWIRVGEWISQCRRAEALPDSDYLSLLRYLSFFQTFGRQSKSNAKSVHLIKKSALFCVLVSFFTQIWLRQMRFDSEHLRTILVSFFTQIWLRQMRLREIHISVLTNPSNNLEKSMYQIWQIYLTVSASLALRPMYWNIYTKELSHKAFFIPGSDLWT